jgi:hypothetical protein
MDCSERDRLKEILHIATKEMAWLYEERSKIAVGHPAALVSFDQEVIRPAAVHRAQAAQNYDSHIETHGCAVGAAGATSGGAWRSRDDDPR